MSKQRYIWIKGVNVPVTEEVYRAYKQAEWREEKQDTVRADRECSFDFMLEHDFDGQADTNQKLVDEIVEDKLLLEMLLAVLAELTSDERALIDALFYQEKSEREAAGEIGLSQKAINKRRHRILEKLRNLMGL